MGVIMYDISVRDLQLVAVKALISHVKAQSSFCMKCCFGGAEKGDGYKPDGSIKKAGSRDGSLRKVKSDESQKKVFGVNLSVWFLWYRTVTNGHAKRMIFPNL